MAKTRLQMYLVLVIFLAALTHGVALYGPQVIDGPDVKIHYRWALQFAAALSEGVWYPRWASYSYFGLGDPTFLYIHPLFYYFVAAFDLVLGNIWNSILAVGAASSAATAVITYWLSRRYASTRFALVAAVAMAISPYCFHLAHYQQFLPMNFSMPFLVLFLGIVSSRDARYRVTLTAMSLALLVMSHVLAAFMALICTSVLILLRAARQRQIALPLLFQHAIGVLLGLTLSAIYLFPALTTQQLVSPTGWYVPIHLDWHNAFLLQYFTLPAFGFRWFHLQWTIPLLTILACAISAYFLWLGKLTANNSWHWAMEMLAVACLALLLGSELAYPLWEHIEILRRLQFPLRFLQIASITAIISLIWSATCVETMRKRTVWVSTGIFLMASIAMLAALERQFAIEAKPVLTIAAPGHTQRGQPEMKPASVGDDWHKFLDEGGWEAECASRNVACTRSIDRTHHKKWEVETALATDAFRLPIFWFPGWEFLINDKIVMPTINSDTGLPTINLQPGKTTVEARWKGIPQEQIGGALSIGAFVTLAWLMLSTRRRQRKIGADHVA
jgi:uncharacterized membrane protein